MATTLTEAKKGGDFVPLCEDVNLDLRGQHEHTRWQTVNVAVVQYPLVGYLTAEQLSDKFENYVSEASAQGAQLILLPELFSLDLLNFSQPEIPQFERVVADIFPFLQDSIQRMATDYNIYIAAGSVPADPSSEGQADSGATGGTEGGIPKTTKNKYRNRSYLFAPGGTSENAVYQEKIFLTPDEKEWGWEGSDTIKIIHAPWGKTAIVICYDTEFPLISQTLADHSIDVLLVPSMTGESGFTRVRWASQVGA
jgi:predicted amidohydrolase